MDERRPAETDTAAADTQRLRVRLIMPDRWLEHVEVFAATTTLEEAKAVGLRAMLLRESDDPADFYVEYAEKQVKDESMTLAELGVQPAGVLSIRAYDLGHYPRFKG